MQNVAGRPEASTTICINLDAIFVSLELSRSTWLVTSRFRRAAGAGCRGIRCPEATPRRSWRGSPTCEGRRMRGQGGASPSSSSKRPGLMASGSTVPAEGGRRAMSSIRIHRCAAPAPSGEDGPRSTARRWSARCWRTSGRAPRLRDGRVPAPEEEDRRRLCRELVPDRRAHPAQPPQGAVLRAGDHRLRAAPPRQARAAGGTLYRRRAVRAGAPEGACAARDRSSGAADPPDRHSQAERNALLAAERAADTTPGRVEMLLRLKSIGPGSRAPFGRKRLFRHFDNRRSWPPGGLAPTLGKRLRRP